MVVSKKDLHGIFVCWCYAHHWVGSRDTCTLWRLRPLLDGLLGGLPVLGEVLQEHVCPCGVYDHRWVDH